MTNNIEHLPAHVGIIMDGNRRWAKQNKLAALQGHAYVTEKVIEPLVDRCIELNIMYLTLWAFSTENWKRDEAEVTGLMNLFRQAFQKQSEALHKKGVRLRTIGDMSKFDEDIQKGAKHWQEISKDNNKITVTFALNYGGRDEILRAIHNIPPQKLATIQEAEFSELLDTRGIPDVDLIIRTGGEERSSGFMPWQAVYAEWFYTPVLMPDFTPKEFDKALANYSNRKRNFGK